MRGLCRRLWLRFTTAEVTVRELQAGDRVLLTSNLSRGPFLTEPLSVVHQATARQGLELWLPVAPNVGVGLRPDAKVRIRREQPWSW